MDRKLIRNYLYNILYQLVKIALPLILVPYTAEHIGAIPLGIYGFAGSIMNWFILFGILGVNTYGNRQIAKVRDDKEELNRTFFEIFSMQICNMIIAMAAYFLYIQLTVHENILFYRLTGLTMLASMLDITWFFYGVEDFKKASIRNIIVKCVGVGLIFLLVKTPADLWKYILMLDKTMVGYLYSEEHVTYYLTSMNIVQMFLYFITSIGSVMLPRVTNVFYTSEDGDKKAQALISTTMKIACLLAFPMCFGMMAIAPNFISWYLPAWYPIIANLIMMGCPIIIFISMSNVTGIQYMVPTGMYQQYSTSVIAGSLINFAVNILLIPKYGAYGAVIGSLIAECSVTSIQLYLIRRKVQLGFRNRSYLIYACGALIMFACVTGAGLYLPKNVLGTLVQVLIGVIVYAGIILVSREELAMKVISKVLKKGEANA